MSRILVMILAVLAGAGLAFEEGMAQQRMPEAGPVQLLLLYRDDLRLTSDQVQRLQTIDDEMDRANQPHVVRMSEIRRKIRELGPLEDLSPERRKQFESYLAEARPVMEKIEHNNRTAMRQLGDVLTDEQKAWVAEQLRNLGRTGIERSGRSSRTPRRGN